MIISKILAGLPWGLLSVLSGVVLFHILINGLVFSKLQSTKEQRWQNIIVFAVLISIINLLLTRYIFNSNDDFESIIKTSKKVLLWIEIMILPFFIWYLGTQVSRFKAFNQSPWKTIFRFWGLIAISIQFVSISFASTGPVLGSIIAGNISGQDQLPLYMIIFGFTLGLLIPTTLILWLFARKYEQWAEKKWWRILQITIGSLLILGTIIQIIYGAIEYNIEYEM